MSFSHIITISNNRCYHVAFNDDQIISVSVGDGHLHLRIGDGVTKSYQSDHILRIEGSLDGVVRIAEKMLKDESEPFEYEAAKRRA